jgi:hypothetical protein
MLRALVVLLLLANAAFFGWTQGWFAAFVPAPHAGEREPWRLARQVQPQRITVLTAQAASAAIAAARTACLEAGPFFESEVGAAEAALAAAGVPAGRWTREPVAGSAAWLVYMGRFADASAQRVKEDELRRRKIDFQELQAPAALSPGLVLARHGTQAGADAALAGFVQQGVRSARVVALPGQVWLRAAQADNTLQAQLLALAPPLISAPFAPCAAR